MVMYFFALCRKRSWINRISVNRAPLFPPLTEEHHLAEHVEDAGELQSVQHNQERR